MLANVQIPEDTNATIQTRVKGARTCPNSSVLNTSINNGYATEKGPDIHHQASILAIPWMVTPRQAVHDITTSDRGNNGKEATMTIMPSHHGNESPYLIIAIIETGHAINTPVIRSNRISNLFWSVPMPTPRSRFPGIPPHPLVAVARWRSQKTTRVEAGTCFQVRFR